MPLTRRMRPRVPRLPCRRVAAHPRRRADAQPPRSSPRRSSWGSSSLQSEPAGPAVPAASSRATASRRWRSSSACATTPRRSRSAARRAALRRRPAGRRRGARSRGTTRSRRASARRSPRWPDGTVDRLNRLAGLHPRARSCSSTSGIALFWAGLAGAEDAWRAARRRRSRTRRTRSRPPTCSIPQYARGLPLFVPSAPLPGGSRRAHAGRPARLSRAARARSRERLQRCYYGVALQRLGRRAPRERVLRGRGAPSARRTPRRRSPPPSAASTRRALPRRSRGSGRSRGASRGPRRVRFHLGLLLLWAGRGRGGETQLGRATRVEPGSPVAARRARYLDALDKRRRLVTSRRRGFFDGRPPLRLP